MKLRYIIFGLTIVATWVVYSYAWMVELYYVILLIMAIISAGAALWVVSAKNFSTRIIVLTAVGWGIGQWWLIELVIVQFLWSKGGFAP